MPPITVDDKMQMFKTALETKSKGSKDKSSSSFDPHASITTYTSGTQTEKSANFGQSQESGFMPDILKNRLKEDEKYLKREINEVLTGEKF
jgi:hypothetical protein